MENLPKKITHQQLWELVVDNVLQNLIVEDNETGYVDPVLLATSLWANLYLEKNMHGDKNKQGRFYWAAYSVFTHFNLLRYLTTFEKQELSLPRNEQHFNDVFASDHLSDAQMIDKFTDKKIISDIHRYVVEDIRKYALWSTLDMLSTHYYFQMDEASFIPQETKNAIFENPEFCAIHYALSDMNWFEEIKDDLMASNLSPSLYRAFDLIKNIQPHDKTDYNSDDLFSHLISLSEHIQQHIAVPLIYKKNDVLSLVVSINQRMRQITGKPFSLLPINDTGMETNAYYPFQHEEMKNVNEMVIPSPIPASHYAFRMKSIKEEAEKFHYLMQTCPELMENQIQEIASWISFDSAAQA